MLRHLLSCLAGIGATLSLAPFNHSWLAPLSVWLFYYLVSSNPRSKSGSLGWFFGLGLVGSGVSWLYVSISTYSPMPNFMAALLIIFMVMLVALIYAVQASLWKRWFSNTWVGLSFVGFWVLAEWLRSLSFTGSWLNLGYASLDTPLAALAPLGGIELTNLVMISMGIFIFEILRATRLREQITYLSLLIAPWLAVNLIPANWTTAQDKEINVSVIQGNIEQSQKWRPGNRYEIIKHYQNLSKKHIKDDLIIWPETAIPALYSDVKPQMKSFIKKLEQNNSSLISGLASQEQGRFYNSLEVLSSGSGLYKKQKLIPFGEYIPWQDSLGDLFKLFNLSQSGFSVPQQPQPLLKAGQLKIAAVICSEIAQASLLAEQAKDADILLTVANDSWFGRSIGPDQHLQIARMRALENQRWLIRSTNNGISGFINPEGDVTTTAELDKALSISAKIESRQGLTPYQIYGNIPSLLLALLFCFMSRFKKTTRRIFN